jgi:hypothetical protein
MQGENLIENVQFLWLVSHTSRLFPDECSSYQVICQVNAANAWCPKVARNESPHAGFLGSSSKRHLVEQGVKVESGDYNVDSLQNLNQVLFRALCVGLDDGDATRS